MSGSLETLSQLRSRMAESVIEAIRRGEKIDSAMQTLFDMVTLWRIAREIADAAAKTSREPANDK